MVKKIKTSLILITVAILIAVSTGCVSKYTKKEVSAEMERLFSQDQKERADAVNKLGDMGKHAADAVPYLIKILKFENDPAVQAITARALGKIGDHRTVDALIDSLYNKAIQTHVIIALGEIRDPSAIDPLTTAMQDENLKSYAKWALDKIDSDWEIKSEVKAHIKKLSSKDSNERKDAAHKLGNLEIFSAPAIPKLVDMLDDNDSDIRKSAAEALTKIGWEPADQEERIAHLIAMKEFDKLVAMGAPAVEGLIYVMRDAKLLHHAMQALDKIDPKWRDSEAAKRVSKMIVTDLKSRDISVYRNAKTALENIGRAAMEPLITALPDHFIRPHAFLALKKIDPNWRESEAALRVIAKFISDLKSQIKYVQLNAINGLVIIGQPAKIPLTKLLSDEELQPNAIKALERIDTGEKVRKFLSDLSIKIIDNEMGKLNDEADAWLISPQQVRRSRVKTDEPPKKSIDDQDSVEDLIKALKDDDSSIRRSAVRTLMKIGKPAVEPLIKALGDEDALVRQYAAWVLGDVGDDRAVEPLIKALGDEKAEVRWTAAEALGMIGDPKAVGPLDNIFRNDPDPSVRNAVKKVLEKFDGR